MGKIDYEIKTHARARRMRLAVHADGRVIVTVPPRKKNSSLIKMFVVAHAQWIVVQREKMAQRGPLISLTTTTAEFQKNKKAALQFFTKKVAQLNAPYQFKYKKICTRNMRGRWGSCSSTGTLTFNYRLIKIPEELADYVITHELCHLAQQNHSSRFWAQVARTMPDYKVRQRALKKFLM